jgi:hypothetical protein
MVGCHPSSVDASLKNIDHCSRSLLALRIGIFSPVWAQTLKKWGHERNCDCTKHRDCPEVVY